MSINLNPLEKKLGNMTTKMKQKEKTFKTKEIDTSGKEWVRDLTKPGNAWVLKKIKK